MRKKRTRGRKKRKQSDVFVSIVKAMRSRSRNGQSVRRISRKSGTTWRTAKEHIDTLRRAGLVETVREKGRKRKKYKLKQ